MKNYYIILIPVFYFLVAPCMAAEQASREVAAKLPESGVWKWTMPGRNGQPEETALTLNVAAGVITGILSDRSGEHSISSISMVGTNIQFTIHRVTPNGKVPVEYSLRPEGRVPKVTVEYPDVRPAAKRVGKKWQIEADATREEPKPKS